MENTKWMLTNSIYDYRHRVALVQRPSSIGLLPDDSRIFIYDFPSTPAEEEAGKATPIFIG